MNAGPVHLSVVVPAFNEAAGIGGTLDTLLATLPDIAPDFEIRIVDDGSADGMGAIVETYARGNPRVVLQREPHRGKGGAVRAGMLAARGELRFLCDADLSMPVHELRRFLELVPARCDIAIGSREGIGARRVGEPGHRHLLGRAFNGLVRALVLPGIEDSQCGFKLFTAAAARRVFPHTAIDGWAFDVEVLAIARRLGLRIMEVPIEWHYREASRVSVLLDPLRMFRDVVRVRLSASRAAARARNADPIRDPAPR